MLEVMSAEYTMDQLHLKTEEFADKDLDKEGEEEAVNSESNNTKGDL